MRISSGSVFLSSAALFAVVTGCSSAPLDTANVSPPTGSGGSTSVPDGGPPDSEPETKPPSVVGPPLTQARSFVVRGQVTVNSPSSFPADFPGDQSFTVRLDPQAKTILMGNAAGTTIVAAATTDNVTFQAPISVALEKTTCHDDIMFSRVQFTVVADTVRGSGVGTLDHFEGDEGFIGSVTVAFTGVADNVPPTLAGGQLTATADPLAPVVAAVSEPLPLQTTAQLSAGGELVALAPFFDATKTVITGFASPNDVALRFGTTYQLIVAPGSDLAGNSGGPVSLTTVSLPPVLAQDGFESAAGTANGTIAVNPSDLPPITGKQSAIIGGLSAGSIVGPVAGLRARLSVPAGAQVVRLSVRPFAVFQSAVVRATFRVAVPGGSIATVNFNPVPQTMPGSSTTVSLSGGQTVYLGAVSPIEVPLPAGAGSEVIFDAADLSAGFECGLPVPSASFLIDDLRVE